ncbi:MAG: peptidoglycan recognition family protein [Planctomycetota bacterium]
MEYGYATQEYDMNVSVEPFPLTGRYELKDKGDGNYWLVLSPDPEQPILYEPPVCLIDELKTNARARWPFPTKDWAEPRTAEDVKYITIHHSAGRREDQNINWWHLHHTKNKSWSRCGYHLGAAAYHLHGEIDLYEMNPWWEWTWHDSRNKDTYGICMAGWLSKGHDIEPNEKQLDCFGRAMAYVLPQFPNLQAIVGHKRWGRTVCPGDLELWNHKLATAADKYGYDIRDLLKPEVPRTRALRSTLLAARHPLRTRLEPPLDSYSDV